VSRALHEIGETRLRAAAHDPGCLTRRVEEQRRDALWARHAHLAQFAPRVLAALDLKAAAGDEPLLDAIRYVEGNCQRQLLPDAPLGVLSPTYRTWVVDEHGRTVRTRYELALWLTARDALRARRLYRAGSHRYGDPAAWMMPPAQWQAERVELAAVFDRPLDGLERLEQLQREQSSSWAPCSTPTTRASTCSMTARRSLAGAQMRNRCPPQRESSPQPRTRCCPGSGCPR
jgi:hypothetical protein